jgi:hypothetical protein
MSGFRTFIHIFKLFVKFLIHLKVGLTMGEVSVKLVSELTDLIAVTFHVISNGMVIFIRFVGTVHVVNAFFNVRPVLFIAEELLGRAKALTSGNKASYDSTNDGECEGDNNSESL